MPIVRRTRAEIDKAKLLAELAARPRPSEEEIGPTRSWLAASRYIRRRRRTRFVPSGRGSG